MVNHLAAIARSFYYMAENNTPRAYETHRLGEKNYCNIYKLTVMYIMCIYFVHEIISIFVQENFLCNPTCFSYI